MEAYDIIMLVVLGAATLFGALKGFAWQVASLTSMVASYLVAYRFRGELASKIDAAPPWNIFLSMLILYVASSSIIWLAFRVVSNTIDRMKMKDFDRQLGAVLGFGKGVLFCAVVTLFAATLLGDAARQSIVRSKSGHYIAKLLHDADNLMPQEVKEVLGPYLHDFDRQIDPTLHADEAGGGERISWDRIVRPPAATTDGQQSPGTLADDLRDELQQAVQQGVEKRLRKSWEAMQEPVDNARRPASGTSR